MKRRPRRLEISVGVTQRKSQETVIETGSCGGVDAEKFTYNNRNQKWSLLIILQWIRSSEERKVGCPTIKVSQENIFYFE